MKLWILYSRFTDDPSLIRGIFTTEAQAEAAQKLWKDKNSDIVEVETDTILTGSVVGGDFYLD